MSGRTPVWNPFKNHVTGSWNELAEMAARGRLTIPSAARRCVDWLTPLPSGGLLATVHANGSVELLPWLGAGEALIQTRIAQLDAAPEPQRSKMAVALADKHYRCVIEEPARIGLPTGLQSFLGARQNPIRMVAMHQQLWLWNEQAWQEQRAAREKIFG